MRERIEKELASASQELLEACKKGALKRALRALELGADPGAMEGGKSALEWALGAPARGSMGCAEALIAAGARVDARKAWEAAFNRDQNARYSDGGHLSPEWVQSGVGPLLAAGADWRAQDEIGRDALMSACWSFRVKAAHELLDAGADPLRRDKHGLQALSMLIFAMTEQGSSARAIPTVMMGFDLAERLALMGSDFEKGPWGFYGPVGRLGDLGFEEGRSLAPRIIGALEAQRVRARLEREIGPGKARGRGPRV